MFARHAGNQKLHSEPQPRGRWRKLMPLALLILAVGAAIWAVLFTDGQSAAAEAPATEVRLVQKYPHDPNSFCQGLVVHGETLLEGTGLYEKSSLKRVVLETGRAVQNVPLDADVFGEGIAVWKDQIVQLTWRNGYLILYDATSFKRTGIVRYRDIDPTLREGWGITSDGTFLILSDGSSQLRFIDPTTFRTVRTITVKNGFRSLSQLNELEYVNGQILANVWYSDRIARIDPGSGKVLGWLDLSRLRPRELRFNREAVLNGIAWDAKNNRLFVTGKNWPSLFEIEVPGI
jgi:glutamine cyclotransferase